MHVTKSHLKNFTSSLVSKNTQIKLFSESSRGGLEVERPLRIQLKALVDWIPLGAILRINSDQKGVNALWSAMDCDMYLHKQKGYVCYRDMVQIMAGTEPLNEDPHIAKLEK